MADFTHCDSSHKSYTHVPLSAHLISRPLRIWSTIFSAVTETWFLRTSHPLPTWPWALHLYNSSLNAWPILESYRLALNVRVKGTQSGPPIRDALGSALGIHCGSNMETHADLTPHWDHSPSIGVKIAISIAFEAYFILGNSPFFYIPVNNTKFCLDNPHKCMYYSIS